MSNKTKLKTLDNFAEVEVDIERITGRDNDNTPLKETYRITLNPYRLKHYTAYDLENSLPEELNEVEKEALICSHMVADAISSGIELCAQSPLARARELLQYLTYSEIRRCLDQMSTMGELSSFF